MRCTLAEEREGQSATVRFVFAPQGSKLSVFGMCCSCLSVRGVCVIVLVDTWYQMLSTCCFMVTRAPHDPHASLAIVVSDCYFADRG